MQNKMNIEPIIMQSLVNKLVYVPKNSEEEMKTYFWRFYLKFEPETGECIYRFGENFYDNEGKLDVMLRDMFEHLLMIAESFGNPKLFLSYIRSIDTRQYKEWEKPLFNLPHS